MPDYVHLTCPNCPRTLRVRREYLGRSIVCNHCEKPFRAEAPSENELAPALESPRPRGADAETKVVNEEAERLGVILAQTELAVLAWNERYESARREHIDQVEAERASREAERKELKGRHDLEKARDRDERQNLQDRLAAIQQQSGHDRDSARAEIETLHCVAESLRKERDAAVWRSAEQARESEHRRKAEADALGVEREEARRLVEALTNREAELSARLRTLSETLEALTNREAELSARLRMLSKTLDRQARDFELERQAFQATLTEHGRETLAASDVLNRDTVLLRKEREGAFQQARELAAQLETNEVALAGLAQSLRDAEERQQSASGERDELKLELEGERRAQQSRLHAMRAELEAGARGQLAALQEQSSLRIAQLNAQTEAIRNERDQLARQCEESRRRDADLSRREADRNAHLEALRETLQRQSVEFEAEREGLRCRLADVERDLDRHLQSRTEPDRPRDPDLENAPLPLPLPSLQPEVLVTSHAHEAHDPILHPHASGGRIDEPENEPAILADQPEAFPELKLTGPESDEPVEDPLRALRNYLREVHTTETIERENNRFFSRISRAWKSGAR